MKGWSRHRRVWAGCWVLLLHLSVAAVARWGQAHDPAPGAATGRFSKTTAEATALRVRLLPAAPDVAGAALAKAEPAQSPAAPAVSMNAVAVQPRHAAAHDGAPAQPGLMRAGSAWFPHLSDRDLGVGYFQQALLLRLGPGGEVQQVQALASQAPQSFVADVLDSFDETVVSSVERLGSRWVCLKLLYGGAERRLRSSLEAHEPWGACGVAVLPDGPINDRTTR